MINKLNVFLKRQIIEKRKTSKDNYVNKQLIINDMTIFLMKMGHNPLSTPIYGPEEKTITYFFLL